LVELLKTKVSPAYIRAASFSLSRMITAEGNARYHSLVSEMLLSFLHDPILLITPDLSTSEETKALTPVEAIQVIQTLLTNTDPAPTLISTVLSPIVTSLYALLGTLAHMKTADPTLRELVRGLLVAWGRVVPTDEAVAILWACVDGQGGEWAFDIAGGVKRVEKCVRHYCASPKFHEEKDRTKSRRWLSSRQKISKRPKRVALLTLMRTSWVCAPTLCTLWPS
jgi:hypothetical protein